MVSIFGRKRRDIINLNAHIFDAGPKFGRFVTLQRLSSGGINWKEVIVQKEAADISDTDTDTVKIAVVTNLNN